MRLPCLDDWFKETTRPGNDRLAVGTAFDLTRSKSDLLAENALLRQQLIILDRQVKRSLARPRERVLLVALASRGTGRSHPADGAGEPDLGCRTHPGRAAEAGIPGG